MHDAAAATSTQPDLLPTGLLEQGMATLPSSALYEALVESRQRWRDVATMTADFVFETDAAGLLVFVAPATVLGWSADALLGRPAEDLLAQEHGPNPFRPSAAFRGRRCWLRRADGTLACMAFASAPLGEPGVFAGSRGAALDVTMQDKRDGEIASALRRGEIIDHILSHMRREVLAPRMMQAVLDELVAATGAHGAAVINLLATAPAGSVLHHTGDPAEPVLSKIGLMMDGGLQDPVVDGATSGHCVIACPSFTRFGERVCLALWRSPGSADWEEDDYKLTASATAIVRVVLEHESIQRELARQARTDPLTGLLNRRSFLEEVNRRMDRLDHDGAPGTLMFVDLDHFKALNDTYGHEVGDSALVAAAFLLRAIVRPMDLVARLGGDEFAVWLDGLDQMTAAERADQLRVQAPRVLGEAVPPGAQAITMSVGIASRDGRMDEGLDSLMRRADRAMYEVKRTGRGNWRVDHGDDAA